MKSLGLHEAIAVVLLPKPNRSATTEEIAVEINERQLWRRKSDGEPVQEFQIMLRAELSGGKYHHLFEWPEPDIVRLRNQ